MCARQQVDDNKKYSASSYRDRLYKEIQKRKKGAGVTRRATASEAGGGGEGDAGGVGGGGGGDGGAAP
jgi:hypothetical protein